MCYRCQICDEVVPVRVPCMKVVTKTRKKFYPVRPKVYLGATSKYQDRKDDPGGVGSEIAQEVNACAQCVIKLKS